MYFDDFIARQTMKATGAPQRGHPATGDPAKRFLVTVWHGLRQIAYGIDAFSSIRHGGDVPPDHGARGGSTRPR